MGFKLGYQAKLYRNTGTHGTPVWNEIVNVKDLTLNIEKDEADVTTRGNNGWKAMVATLKDASLDFDMVWDTGDEDFTALQESFFDDTTVEVLCLDGAYDTVGSQGLQATVMVKNFSRDEKLADALMAKVKIRPTYSSYAPEWFTAT